MRVRRRADHTEMPWRNGGGSTLEVVRWPEGSTMDDFDWRISFAHVERGGPFSAFPGVDRVILLVRGGRLVLTVDGDRPHDLGLYEPFRFPGEAHVTSDITQPSLDCNLMTRRGRVAGDLEVVHLAEPLPVPAGALVAVLEGEVSVDEVDWPVQLACLDVAGPLEHPATVRGPGAVVAVVRLGEPA